MFQDSKSFIIQLSLSPIALLSRIENRKDNITNRHIKD